MEQKPASIGVTVVVASVVSLSVSAVVTLGVGAGMNTKFDFIFDEEVEYDPDDVRRGELEESISGWLDGGDSRSYHFDLLDDAVMVNIELDSADGDVDLYVTFGRDAFEVGEWWRSSYSDEWNETIEVVRHNQPEWSDALYVNVTNAEDEGLGFELFVETRVAGDGYVARVGDVLEGSIDHETGHRLTYKVVVPHDADAIRFDLDGVSSDLDLFASVHEIPLDTDEAQMRARSALCRESLVIDGSSEPQPLVPGSPLYLVVADLVLMDDPIPFRLHVTSGRKAPATLREFPEFPTLRDERDRALLATVEVISGTANGSGVIVSPEGLLLTAYHLIEDPPEDFEDNYVVGLSFDPRRPSREVFRASVVFIDEELDLALLQLDTDFYGEPIPDDLELPWIAIEWKAEPRIGDTITTIGYPEPGGLGSRVPITYDRGVLSGYSEDGQLLKTNAMVASDSSGGAALNADHKLVGIILSSQYETGGSEQIGYVAPIHSIPSGWKASLGQ